MGRAKLKMEIIQKEKARLNTFKKRKQGLLRKMHEFTTLCDVSAAMIIYGPKQDVCSSEPEIWPENNDEVRRVIDTYRARKKDSNFKPYGVAEFLNDRKIKIEEELMKRRKKNMEAKYPTWVEFMDFFTELELRDFAASLKKKADLVKSRIEFLRGNKQGLVDNTGLMNYYGNNNNVNMVAQPQMQVPNFYPGGFDHQNQNSMMMLLANGNYNNHDDLNSFSQFGNGGASTSHSSDFGCRSSYDQGTSFFDMGWDGPKPISQYCGGAPGSLPQYMQMGQQQQVQFTKMEEGMMNEGWIGGDQERFQMSYNSNNIGSYNQ